MTARPPRPEKLADGEHTFRDDLNALAGFGVPTFIADHLAEDFDEAVGKAGELTVRSIREQLAELAEDRTATDPDDEWHRGFHEAVRRLRDALEELR